MYIFGDTTILFLRNVKVRSSSIFYLQKRWISLTLDFNTVCSNELDFKTASVSINNIKNRKLQDFINRYFWQYFEKLPRHPYEYFLKMISEISGQIPMNSFCYNKHKVFRHRSFLNQWTGSYMITTSVMKELNTEVFPNILLRSLI